MNGLLLVAGTTSDAGKSVLTAGLCRWLARAGVKVAPFKAQNMALNSYVTHDGAEIGRAQAMQAAAAGIEPEAAMNPVLLKPGADATSQVVLLGRPAGAEDARSYQQRKRELLPLVIDVLHDLRSRFDVVICEGAGSPTEINLRAADIANMGLARAAAIPTIVVGDIDRGGVFAALYGTVALLGAADQALVCGFVINKFRGDQRVLDPGLRQLHRLTGRPVFGVLPYAGDLRIDAEDSLALDAPLPAAQPPLGADGVEVAVLRLPYLSNATDVDALACEPGVGIRFTTSAADVERADLVVLPGTRATVAALDFLRSHGLDAALRRRAGKGDPIMGICGGYQLLGGRVVDDVESGRGEVDGLGLLPVDTVFVPDKTLARPEGVAPAFGSAPAAGYEIHHGLTTVHGGTPLLVTASGTDGCVEGASIGTSWHGVFEGDQFRRAVLRWVADRRGLSFIPGSQTFADVRERRLDFLADLVEAHLDTAALQRLLDGGAPAGLPVLTGGLA